MFGNTGFGANKVTGFLVTEVTLQFIILYLLLSFHSPLLVVLVEVLEPALNL